MCCESVLFMCCNCVPYDAMAHNLQCREVLAAEKHSDVGDFAGTFVKSVPFSGKVPRFGKMVL
jgi:predicted transcriptional regulator